MNRAVVEQMAVLWALVAGVLLLIPAAITYRSYLRCRFFQAMLWALLAVALASVFWIHLGNQTRWHWLNHSSSAEQLVAFLCYGLVFFFAVPLVVRVVRMWLFDIATPTEILSGSAGIRAAITPSNTICVLGTALCAWLGWGYSFWAIAAQGTLLILAYPLGSSVMAHSIAASPISTSQPTEDLAGERERVLKLLEDGKITVDESTELLSALGATVSQNPVALPITPPRRLILVGAAVVLLGFFLPWYAINLGHEMSRATGQMQQQFQQQMQQMQNQIPQNWGDLTPGSPSVQQGAMQMTTNTTYIAGGNIGSGMGWFILALSIAVAVLMLITQINPVTARLVGFICLGVGAVLLFYLLTSGIRYVYFGLLVVLAGYVLQAFGLWRDLLHSRS